MTTITADLATAAAKAPLGARTGKPRILTGDRPTGPLHLGHYVGSIRHRISFQDAFDCFFIVADLHMLTTMQSKDAIARSAGHARDIVLDQLALGIDPDKVTFFLQSAIHETYQLQLLLSGLVTVERLQQLPTIKDMAAAAGLEQIPYNLLGYPVLQAADILGPRAHRVPVGKDNESHVELARQIARRFNDRFGEVFPLPEPFVVGGSLPGTDGQGKMSKSLGNCIFIADDVAAVRKKVMGMYTDPRRVHADVPGTVEGNPVFSFHDHFNPDGAEVADLKARYEAGRVGDVEVKEQLVTALEAFLGPVRERRAHYAAQAGLVDHLLHEGTLKMRVEAAATLSEVKKAMGLAGVWNSIRRKAEKHGKRAEAEESSAGPPAAP